MTMTPVRRTSRSALPDPAELLIKEARRRTRRRRLIIGLILAVILGACATAISGGGSGHNNSVQAKNAEPGSHSVAGTWSSAKTIKAPIGFNNFGDEVAANSVSCGSAQSCSAVGFISNSRTTEAFVTDERNGTWSGAAILPGLAALNTGNSAQLNSISCVAVDCSAVGWYTDRSKQMKVFVADESDKKWSMPITIKGLTVQGINANVSGIIACATAVNCVVSGSDSVNSTAQRSSPARPFIIDEVNGRWQKAMAMPGMMSSGRSTVNVTSVSCASVGNCFIGGSFADTGGTTAFIDSEIDGVWETAVPVPGITTQGRFNSNVASISCGSANSCSAGGTYSNRYGNILGFLTNESDGSWGAMMAVIGPPSLHLDSNSGITSLSCRSADDCTALGYSNYQATGERLFVVREINGAWDHLVVLGSVATPTFDGFGGAMLSCGAPGDCAVGGLYSYYGDGVEPFVADETNGVWDRAIEIPGIAELNVRNYGYVQAISCGAAANCAVVGGYSGSSEAPGFFVSTQRPSH